MSFGIGIGDVFLVSKIAWTIYKSCKDSGDDFKRLSSEVASLHVVLKETEDYANEFAVLDTSRVYRLNILTDGCTTTLKDLEKLLNSYESLGTQAQRTWDRMRFGLEDLADVRLRLVSHVTLLTAFNSTLMNSSTTRIEKRLNKFISEVRAGYREGSIVTTDDATENIESPDVWHQLRRELEDVGISPVVMEENHLYISNWMKVALSQGLSNELPPDDLEAQPNDLGNGGSVNSSSMATIVAKDSEFETELRKKQAEKPVEEIVSPTIKKRMDPSRLIQKLFRKDTAIIQAASDGDLNAIAKLISIGCNVNARDRWGWSALSMAAYGNHLTIARLLLEHGAKLDNVDVDGDTPRQLATNRGHSDMVILLDEVCAQRDLQAREKDTEQPRW
ncbi:hypothetical protein J3R30DRAFT_3699798 [Lentinula aciculospora]|uniref:Ankyrin n=1 Tax=Lentinula aciculospora TaxID=153920 RepID=A0A9W9AIG5_9AGAR|nr:hypothetical protein J3R30DRAFT_3699798 [Lentinula aciculospora]